MKNKTLTWVLFILGILLLTAAYLPSQLMEKADSMLANIDRIENAALSQKWSQASTYYDTLRNQWSGRKYWYMLIYAEEDFSEFDQIIARMEPELELSDQVTVLSDCNSAKNILNKMNSMIPHP